VENPIKANLSHFLYDPRGYLDIVSNRIRDPLQYNHIDHSKELLIGKFIKDNYPENITIVYDQMGQAPYMAGHGYTFIDSWGLTDQKIGHFHFYQNSRRSTVFKLYGHILRRAVCWAFPEERFFTNKDEVLDYIFSRDPEIIIVKYLLLYDEEKIPSCLLADKRVRSFFQARLLLDNWTLVLEKKNRHITEYRIPEGLPVLAGEALASYIKNSPTLKGVPTQ